MRRGSWEWRVQTIRGYVLRGMTLLYGIVIAGVGPG